MVSFAVLGPMMSFAWLWLCVLVGLGQLRNSCGPAGSETNILGAEGMWLACAAWVETCARGFGGDACCDCLWVRRPCCLLVLRRSMLVPLAASVAAVPLPLWGLARRGSPVALQFHCDTKGEKMLNAAMRAMAGAATDVLGGFCAMLGTAFLVTAVLGFSYVALAGAVV